MQGTALRFIDEFRPGDRVPVGRYAPDHWAAMVARGVMLPPAAPAPVPVAEQPTAGEPAVDEPAVDEPKTDETPEPVKGKRKKAAM
jgi:hypothetical protein